MAPAANGENHDFSTLGTSDRYARYFNQLEFVFELLIHYHAKLTSGSNFEHTELSAFFRRLLRTIAALRLKYTHAPGRPLWIDFSTSGFPNFLEVSALQADYEARHGRLAALAPLAVLKQRALDALFERLEDPREILAELSELSYLSMLGPESVAFPVNIGSVLRTGERDGCRTYAIAWSCYDFQTNCPYFHVLSFDQNAAELPLEEEGRNYHDLCKAIQADGSRAPEIGILAAAIDEAGLVLPKILKRIAVGPLYSALLLAERSATDGDAVESALRPALLGQGETQRTFALFFTEEIVVSKRQELTRSILSPAGKVRQIFAIEETDPECYRRRASMVLPKVILPHALLQHLSLAEQRSIPSFERAKKLTFDDRGELHGI